MELKTIPLLSKTRFMGGIQCHKRLYLDSYKPDLASPIDESKQALFDNGHAVGHLATKRFPGGVLVREEHGEHALAMEKTQGLVADESIPSLFEAAFSFDGIRIRVDVLKRVNNLGFLILEVKSSTKVKPEHIPDAAVQVYVAEGTGLTIRKVYLVHIDSSYVYQGGEYELDKLLRAKDITSEVRAYLSGPFRDKLADMKRTLAELDVPAIDIGKHCNRPYECPFYAYCRKGLSEHHIEQLPGVRRELLEALLGRGVSDIRDIPSEFPGMSLMQARAWECVVSGQPYVGPDLVPSLSEIQYPLLFIDFETFNPGLPLYKGTRPYQVIPFQWSMHIQVEGGNLDHKSFLYEGRDDPRPAFIESLLEAAGTAGTIVVYSPYEETQIRHLAADFPEYRDGLLRLPGRMFDLLKILRAHYYHPEFHGSYSIKSVLGALVSRMSYEDLHIQDGNRASVAYAKMISPDISQFDRQDIRDNLLAYCERDTEAMVEVFRELRGPSVLQSRLF